jgi:hypothetical protein
MAETWNDTMLPWQNTADPWKTATISWNNVLLPWKQLPNSPSPPGGGASAPGTLIRGF